MLQAVKNTTKHNHSANQVFLTIAPNLSRCSELRVENTAEVLGFLSLRPVHTVVMTSFINDNGIENPLNRGKFFGYRNERGLLEGVALIGHTTLVEARTDEALKAFAFKAKTSETPLHIIMSGGEDANKFWNYYAGGTKQPRHTFTELLFEIKFPLLVKNCKSNLRLATKDELLQVAKAQAEVAFLESGTDPLVRDREGFLKRCERRIEQGRTFVVIENGQLIFKAEVMAETAETIYLEGIYVVAEQRGKGIGSDCLSKLSIKLLQKVTNICFLSNVTFKNAHRSFVKAGYKNTDSCTTLFV
jgi:uncharacterized protein